MLGCQRVMINGVSFEIKLPELVYSFIHSFVASLMLIFINCIPSAYYLKSIFPSTGNMTALELSSLPSL